MLITIVDVESTGLDPATHEVIEVAAILYSVPHRAVLQQVSTLLPITAAINAQYCTNGIEAEWAGLGFNHEKILDTVDLMLFRSDYIVSFNSDFDRQWFNGRELPIDYVVSAKWSDAAAIRYPRPSGKRDLVNLCLAHGIPVVSAHRAMDDCRLLAELLGKVPDLEGELARAARPKVLVRALVPFERKDEARAAGFVWDSLVPRAWAKRMPLDDVGELPFEVVEVVL